MLSYFGAILATTNAPSTYPHFTFLLADQRKGKESLYKNRKGSSMTSIEVSVRVRPFNSREMKFNCELVIGMPNSTTCEIKTTSGGAPKKFNFDHCLWTFRGEEGDENKHAHVTDLTYADQLYTYNAVGQRMLLNALQGFNACLFAYGQTGSGKTYSMMGTGSDPGIIPRLAQDLFQQERNSCGDDAFTLAVEVTYLEIYNESVKDLLNAKNMDKALRVRQHPKFGVYVEGLTKWTVNTEAEILKLLEDGASVRSVAATKMNATSSRSHAILTLHIKKKTQNAELVSQLHLVDLAGSERASSTGAEGDTLMEGANINKSLTTLGMCLSRLAEVSGGGSKGHVPYRDSQLTWLLNDSLGGNSKTAMLANISPASINAEETLSTLRFASTVKKIKNNAVINEDPQQRLIRELREEIADIKKKIIALEAGLGPEDELQISEDRDHGEVVHDEAAVATSAPVTEVVVEVAAAAGGEEDAHAPSADSVIVSVNAAVGDDAPICARSTAAGSATSAIVLSDDDEEAPTVPVANSQAAHATADEATETTMDDNVDDADLEGRHDANTTDQEDAPSADTSRSSSTPTNDSLRLPVDATTAVEMGKPPRSRKDSRRVVIHSPPDTGRGGMAETHEDLLNRLEEDASLMMQMIETDEDKMTRTQAQTLDNQQAMADLKELQVSVKLTCPRLVTLNEDLHALPSVALLYYLREGDLWLGNPSSAATTNNNDDDDALETTTSELVPTLDIPAAGCRPNECILEKHVCIRVDGLRQEVKLIVPERVDAAATSGAAVKPARVYVNGVHVEPGTQRTLRHTDRVVVGLVAFRHSQPIRWINDALKDDFIRLPSTLHHAVDVEAYSRLECVWAEQQELRQLLKTVTQPEGDERKSVESWQNDLSVEINATTLRMATLEELLVAKYPLTQDFLIEAALAAETATSSSTTLYDYDYAMQEIRTVVDEHRREREKHQETLKALKQAEVNREAQILALREELQRQEAAKQEVALERLDAAEVDARDEIEGDLYDDLKELVELWKADRIETRRRLEERLRREMEARKVMIKLEADTRKALDVSSSEETVQLLTEEKARRQDIIQAELLKEQQQQQRASEEREKQAEAERAKAEAAAQIAAAATEKAQAEAQTAPTADEPVAPIEAPSPTPPEFNAASAEDDAPAAAPVAPTPTRSQADARSRRLSMRASLPASRHVDVMVQLAADVRQYEEACREATLWKPNGPTKTEDLDEYKFSMDSPTTQEVMRFESKTPSGGLEGVLLAQDVYKLKRGFLGRLSYHKVHVLVRERFLYYFPGSDACSRALGAAYLFGAGVEKSSTAVEGKKFTLRVVPSVPRKPTKSSRGSTDENNVLFAFDTSDECDAMATLIQRLSAPDCPLNVKQFYAQQQTQLNAAS